MAFTTTVDGLLARVRRDAQLTLRPKILTLDGGISGGATTFAVNEDSQVGAGSIAAIDTELFYITAKSERTFTVIPGFEGTTQAAHSDNAVVEIDPRLPKAVLIDMALHEIHSWGSQLYRVTDVDVTVNTSERTYQLATSDPVLFLLDVRGRPVQTAGTWGGDSWPHVKARLLRDLPSTDFASGVAVQLDTYPAVSLLHVVYGTPFDTDPFDLSTDLVSSVGLTQGQIDVLEAGLRWRILSSGLIPRTNWQAAGMSRDSEEVTALDVVRAADMARALRDRRLADEGLELQRQWPTRES